MPHAVDQVKAFQAEDVLRPQPFSGSFNVSYEITASNTDIILQGVLDGPEHLALCQDEPEPKQGSHWQLWTATKNGTVYSVPFVGNQVQPEKVQEHLYAGPGRVLGVAWHTQDGKSSDKTRLYICNSLQVCICC